MPQQAALAQLRQAVVNVQASMPHPTEAMTTHIGAWLRTIDEMGDKIDSPNEGERSGALLTVRSLARFLQDYAEEWGRETQPSALVGAARTLRHAAEDALRLF